MTDILYTYQGVVFDIVDEVIIATAPAVVSTYAVAFQHAAALCPHINDNPGDYNGFSAHPDTDCYVLRNGHLMLTDTLLF